MAKKVETKTRGQLLKEQGLALKKIKLTDPQTEWKKLESKPKYFSCFFGGE